MKQNLKLIIALISLYACSLFGQSTANSYTRTLQFFNSDLLQIYEGARIAAPTMTLPNSLTTYTSTLQFFNSDNRQIYNAVRGIGDAVSSATNLSWNLSGNSITGATEFLGTTSNNALYIKTNNTTRLGVESNGLLTLNSNTNTSTTTNGSIWYNSNTNNGFQLHSNDATNSGYHSVFSNSTAALGIYLSNAGGTKVQIGTQTNDDLGFFTGTGSVKMRINKNGNVGINLASDPTATLHVQGTMSVSGTSSVNSIYNAGFYNKSNYGIYLDFSGTGLLTTSFGGNGGTGIASYLSSGALGFLLGGTSGTEVARFTGTTGNLLINTSTDTPSAKLKIESTSQGVLFPRMTTAQKNAISSPAEGLIVYDLTLRKLCVFTTVWEVITSL